MLVLAPEALQRSLMAVLLIGWLSLPTLLLFNWLVEIPANLAGSVTRTTLQCGLVLAMWEGKIALERESMLSTTESLEPASDFQGHWPRQGQGHRVSRQGFPRIVVFAGFGFLPCRRSAD